MPVIKAIRETIMFEAHESVYSIYSWKVLVMSTIETYGKICSFV
jgi:hypothetical protein